MKHTNILRGWMCLVLLLGGVGMSWGQTEIAGTFPGGTMSGYYKLIDNVTLQQTITVEAGKTLTIDLNGYVLNGNQKEWVLRVPAGTTLMIKDDGKNIGHSGRLDDKGVYIWTTESANLPIYGGIILNKRNGDNATKGIYVEGTCTVEKAIIVGCYSSTFGAAVTVSSTGTFTMKEGQISYNHSATTGNAGVIYGEPKNNNGKGAMISFSNTTISHNNTNGYGGAIFGYNVSLNKCTVEYNTAQRHGGGLYIQGTGLNLSITNNTIIQHNKALGTVNEDKISYGCGGGIYVGRDENGGTCTIEDSEIDSNYSSVGGGGIYSLSTTTIKGSKITKNYAMYSEEKGKPRYNSGRGGGFYFAGYLPTDGTPFKPEFILENTNVDGNACMYYGGGGQICIGGILILKGSTTINKNEAILAGAGGVHVTNDATLNLESGEISSNVAHTIGGAIHSSYTCQLNLTSGTISNNLAHQRGGGVHVNTGGNLELQGTIITNNEAKQGLDYKYSTVDIENHTYTVPTANSSDYVKDTGYGGGVLIDAGTCTMTAGELTNNKAEIGGGGIALVMLNMPVPGSTHFDEIKVVELELKAGKIEGNTTEGYGAGVYIMENKMASELQGYIDNGDLSGIDINSEFCQGLLTGISKAAIVGGTLTNNTAKKDGGALFVNGNVEMIDGTFKNNKATNGGGICVEGGTVNITKGTISNNTATNYGGGIYVTNTDPDAMITISGEGIFEENQASAGGGMAVNGPFTFNFQGTLQNNTAKNGGGIYLMPGTGNSGNAKGVTLNFNGGFIRNNVAEGTSKLSEKTAYQKGVNDVEGVGGGVFLADNTTLTFDIADKQLGFYGNQATNAADDIFANGKNTSVTLPAVAEMTLTDFSVPAGELYWIEDYYSHYDGSNYESDAQYDKGIKNLDFSTLNLTPTHNVRYRHALENAMVSRITNSKVEATVYTNYVCLALGYQIFYVTIKKTGLKDGESALFDLSYIKNNGITPYLTMLLKGDKAETTVDRRVALPEGEWKVGEQTGWSWTYKPGGATSVTKEVKEAGITFEFTNTKNNTGILHDEDIEVNKMGQATSTAGSNE